MIITSTMGGGKESFSDFCKPVNHFADVPSMPGVIASKWNSTTLPLPPPLLNRLQCQRRLICLLYLPGGSPVRAFVGDN